MATPTTIDPELVRRIIAEPFVMPDSVFKEILRGWSLAYKRIDTFHFSDCGCDECGAYRRVGIG
jgi:hypothetical protein